LPPVNAPAERRFESLQGLAGDRIDHLLMKARIGVARSKTSGDQQFRVVEIYRRVVGLVGTVVVDDREPLPYRSGQKFLVTDRRRHVVADKLA
jgi:hypothetical protein